MKSPKEQVQFAGFVSILLSLALVLATLAAPPVPAQLSAQSSTTATNESGKDADKKGPDKDDNFNSPPFDFNDNFYTENGVDFNKLNANGLRFGFNGNRLTGPPAGPGQVNWVVNNSNTDPDRNNVRILATTGGYKDDTGSPTQFISIIAFMNDRTFFLDGNRTQQAGNARGLAMEDIAANFEAYAGLRQVGTGGVFHPTPCASIGDPVQVAAGNCFSVASVATPNLRQDWRFSTNRNAIDGSAPLSYFGDNLLGLWIITYFWYTAQGFGPGQTPDCKAALAFLAARNGVNLDGTPLIKTGAELHFVESNLQGNEAHGFPPPPTNACAAENNLDRTGADGGAVWLVCPSIPDPTQGGIALDAFVDTARELDGTPLDPQVSASFNCLQKNGQFCRLANGTFTVMNQTSYLFWDSTPSPTSSNGVQLNPLNTAPTGPTASSQLWTFTANPDGTYRIVNKATGLALTDPRRNKVSGTTLIQSSPDSDADEKWIVTPLNNGFRIINLASHLAVDATSPTPNPGTDIVQATPTGETNQVWVIR